MAIFIIYFYFITFRLFGDEVIDSSLQETNEGDENEDITEIVDIADLLEGTYNC
jgi:hypothetical protein